MASLDRHMQTKKQKDAMSVSNVISTIPFPKERVNVSVKIAEARMPLLVAKHTSINTADHITVTVKASFTDSVVAGSVSLGRTKCSAFKKNVWYPHFIKALREYIADNFFSILVDESTDISVSKQLGIVLKYFCASHKKVVGTFLKLQIVEAGKAKTIVKHIKNVVSEFGLDIQKCVGTDNASVMVGRHNGVHALLKKEVKHLVLVPCVCHFL